MRIKHLKINSFGKLSNVGITLDDKVTVITGKNEAGKSTVSSFIKYMLYGFENTKKQNLSENDKKKYMSWSGEDVSGEMTFENGENEMFTAVRHTGKRSTNTIVGSDGLPVTSDDAGQYFLGVNESCYKKTAFIGSSVSSFTDDGELSMALRNMVYNADEKQDSDKALKRLEELRKFYLGKAERSGRIFELEKELALLIEERDKWKDGHKKLLSAEHDLKKISSIIKENKERLSLLNEEKQNLEYKKAMAKLENIIEAKKKVDDSQGIYASVYKLMQNGDFLPTEEYLDSIKALLSRIDEIKSAIGERQTAFVRAKENVDRILSDKSLVEIFARLDREGLTSEELLSRISAIEAQRKKAKKLAIIFTVLVITLPAAIFFYIKASKASEELKKIAENFGCGSIETLTSRLSSSSSFAEVQAQAKRFADECESNLLQKKKELDEKNDELAALLAKAGVGIENADEYVCNLSEWLDKTAILKQNCREAFSAYNALISGVDVEALRVMADKYDEAKDKQDEKSLMQKIAFYTQSIDALIPKERELEKNAAVLSGTLPKPAEIQSKILSIEENLKEMKTKHNAIVLAIETLERASESMKSEVAPKIVAETSRLFGEITDGKYRGLYTDSEMNLSFLSSDDADVKEAGYLSTGTIDAAYICLRIALCKFLYKEKPTLVFDDAFSHMDDERLAKTLSFIEELSNEFQIVILSCHDREKRFFDEKAKLIDFVIE